MKAIKAFALSILSLFLPALLNAQRAEIGLQFGSSHFWGDVGPYGLELPQGYNGGLFFRYNIDPHWAVRLGGNYGTLTVKDANAQLAYRRNRNLSFRTDIWEGYLTMEFNYFEFKPGTPQWHTPYLLGGIGGFGFNPEARYRGRWYELQPLGTEGQGTTASEKAPYALARGFLLFGMGYKFALSRHVTLGLEMTFRDTQTDYLDDASGFYADPLILAEERGLVAATLSDRSLSPGDKTLTYRGNPANDDWYIFSAVTLQVRFERFYEKCATFVR